MSAIQFRFGLSLDGHPVNIKDAAKGKSYTCVNCGKPLIAKQGKVREWHFAHKTNTSNCSFETYLHKLAKYFIREMFNEKQSLVATFGKATQTCKWMDVCPFRKDNSCHIIKDESIDLLQYTACVEEASINGFIADLLFTSETLDPLLIEIYVTHPCTEEKIKSGLKIIEIHIESETDVENLLNGLSQSEKVVFHNFYKDECSELTTHCPGHNVFHGFVKNERFMEEQGNCKDSFWSNPEYMWELFAEEQTHTFYVASKRNISRPLCEFCSYFGNRSAARFSRCLFPDNYYLTCYSTSSACSHFFLEVDIPSVCHRDGLSFIFHHPEHRLPQRLTINNTQ